jgi:hypothetical protein
MTSVLRRNPANALTRLFLPGVRRRARRRRFGGNRTVVPLQRGEPPPRVTVGDAVGRRELFRRDIALDGPRHDAFAERHFGLEKLAVERRRADVIIPIALVQPGAKPRNST